MGVTYTQYIIKYEPYLGTPTEEVTLYYNPYLDAPADNEYLYEILARRLGIHPDQIRDVTIIDNL